MLRLLRLDILPRILRWPIQIFLSFGLQAKRWDVSEVVGVFYLSLERTGCQAFDKLALEDYVDQDDGDNDDGNASSDKGIV